MNWSDIERIFLEASVLPAADRPAFLNLVCKQDTELRREVESLLRADADHGRFLKDPPARLAASLLERLSAASTAIGPYRVIRVLGEGGMGRVYEAEQQTPRRTVALKVIKAGMAGDQIVRRFRQESEALGRLQHPGIAQIYDAGTAEQGFEPQPYFAMELIDGLPILRYAGEAKLNTGARLQMMAKVCDAVDHAHQRGILHRDLKPGNILVDRTGQPKVLDFGVARVMDSDLQATRQTDLGQLVGTLAYMSPEQASGDAHGLDIRSDVYALGVILYELLAGQLPYHIKGLALHEVVQTIREQDPMALGRLDAEYRGDVQIIVQKALEKNKHQRYQTAAELARDIRRYLLDEPITARPASALYQLKKFTRRHRTLVAGTAVVLVVLIGGVIVSTYQSVRARKAERQANVAAASAQAVNEFLKNDLLAQASPDKQKGSDGRADPNLTVRDALDRASLRINGKFQKQPEVEADIRTTIANTYLDLDLFQQARPHLQRALDLQRGLFGPTDARTLRAQTQLGYCLLGLEKFQEAERLVVMTIADQRRVLSPDHPDLQVSRRVLARLYYKQAKYHQAATLMEEALAIQRRVLGPDDPATIDSLRLLSVIYSGLGDFARQESLLQQAIELDRRALGPEHGLTLWDIQDTAVVYLYQGRFQEAEKVLRQLIPTFERLKGPDHIWTLGTIFNLGQCLYLEHRYQESEVVSRDALNRATKKLGLVNVPAYVSGVAEALLGEKRYAESEHMFKQSWESFGRVYGQDHPLTTDVAIGLALAYLDDGKFTASEPVARQVMEIDAKTKPDGIERFMAESLVGASLMGQKQFAKAEPLLLEGYRGIEAHKDKLQAFDRYRTVRVRGWIERLYRDWGKPQEAKLWQQ